ncbi:hypothetical protein PO909_032042 [Leuciscus waleckii]
MADGVDLSRKFVSESELDELRKKRQEEWEKVRKPDDPEEAPEEAYDPRSLFERLQEQKDKKQEEYEEQFKFNLSDDTRRTVSGGLPLPSIFDLILGFIRHRLCKNMRVLAYPCAGVCLSMSVGVYECEQMGVMEIKSRSVLAENMVKGLDEDESSFLDEVSRQQSLIEKHRRDEEAKEIKEYRISFCTLKHSVSMFTFVKLMLEASAVKRNDGCEPHSALQKLAATDSQKKEPEKKAGPKPSETHRTSHLSQAHLLAGAVKRRRYLNIYSIIIFRPGFTDRA